MHGVWPNLFMKLFAGTYVFIGILYTTYIQCRFGCAKVMISDQGREFVNNLNSELMQFTGTEHHITSAYHPQANGLVERFNQTSQNSLRKCSTKCNEDWDIVLPSVLFAIRTCAHKATKYSPFELMFNR